MEFYGCARIGLPLIVVTRCPACSLREAADFCWRGAHRGRKQNEKGKKKKNGIKIHQRLRLVRSLAADRFSRINNVTINCTPVYFRDLSQFRLFVRPQALLSGPPTRSGITGTCPITTTHALYNPFMRVDLSFHYASSGDIDGTKCLDLSTVDASWRER